MKFTQCLTFASPATVSHIKNSNVFESAKSFQDTTLTIPNSLLGGSLIVNMTRMPTRRTSVDVGISYSSDVEQAIKIALDPMKSHPLVLQDPQPSVVTTEPASSYVNLQLRAWAKTGDTATVKNNLTAGIFEAYKREGIEMPFPQMDIYIKEQGIGKKKQRSSRQRALG